MNRAEAEKLVKDFEFLQKAMMTEKVSDEEVKRAQDKIIQTMEELRCPNTKIPKQFCTCVLHAADVDAQANRTE